MTAPPRDPAWFGRESLIALSFALFADVVPLFVIPYVLGPLAVLYLLQILVALSLFVGGGSERRVGVGLLIAALTAVASIAAGFLS